MKTIIPKIIIATIIGQTVLTILRKVVIVIASYKYFLSTASRADLSASKTSSIVE